MRKIVNLLKNINYLMKNNLWKKREEDIVYLTNKILDDAIYEYNINPDGYMKPKILSKKESLELIIQSGKSFVRTGDGECRLIMGEDQPFQKYDRELADRLKEVLMNKDDNLLVGINGNYFLPLYVMSNPTFYRRYAYDLRQIYSQYIDINKTYIHAAVTGYQFGRENEKDCIEQYNMWHHAFEERNVVLVCGEGVISKVKYDVFDLAKSKKVIIGPNRNAWEQRESLMKQILETATKEDIIVFVLGMAGKAMTADLARMGYTCWDVGHLVKFYDVFMQSKPMSKEDITKFYAPD